MKIENNLGWKGNVLGGIILAVILIVLLAWANSAHGTIAKDDILPQSPAAEKTYQQDRIAAKNALQKLCASWKDLSKAKISDKINNVLKEDRVNDWNANLSKDCTTVDAPYGF